MDYSEIYFHGQNAFIFQDNEVPIQLDFTTFDSLIYGRRYPQESRKLKVKVKILYNVNFLFMCFLSTNAVVVNAVNKQI